MEDMRSSQTEEPDCPSDKIPDGIQVDDVEIIEVTGIKSDIEQGRKYGEALAKERYAKAFREGQIQVYTQSCHKGYLARQKRNKKTEEVINKVSEEISKPWWNPF